MIAFICNSPVQIMRAVQMKLTMPEFSDEADVYITPCFTGAENVKNNLQKTKCFSNVEFVEEAKAKHMKSLWYAYGFGKYQRKLRRRKYNKLVSFNAEGFFADAVYNLNKKNKGFEYHYVEDCPTVYLIPIAEPYQFFLYRLLGYEKTAFHMDRFWTSCPELMKMPEEYHAGMERLPKFDLNNQRLVDIINQVFGTQPDSSLEDTDLLIMDESFYQDGRMLDDADYKIYSRIKERYPDKKILVKMHPRTMHNRYEKTFEIYDTHGIPWEICVMNRLRSKSKELKMISLACATMTSDKLMFGSEGTKLMILPLFYDKVTPECQAADINEERTELFERLKKTYDDPEKLQIIYSEKQLFDVVGRILNGEQA